MIATLQGLAALVTAGFGAGFILGWIARGFSDREEPMPEHEALDQGVSP